MGLLLAAVPARAHHAFAAKFDAAKPIKVRGTVVKWELTNPHSWVHIDVKGADGTIGGGEAVLAGGVWLVDVDERPVIRRSVLISPPHAHGPTDR